MYVHMYILVSSPFGFMGWSFFLTCKTIKMILFIFGVSGMQMYLLFGLLDVGKAAFFLRNKRF